MYLIQTMKNVLTSKSTLINLSKKNFISLTKNFKLINQIKDINFNKIIFSKKYFFSSNKEQAKDTKKGEVNNDDQEKKESQQKTNENSQNESKKNNGNDEEERSLSEKYKELKTLYNEQEQKLDQVKKKFHEIKDLYLKGVEEIDAIKLRNDREIKNTKDYAITKFAKDLLDVHDNFTRALGVISDKDFSTLSEEEKNETFNCFVEGKNNFFGLNFLFFLT